MNMLDLFSGIGGFRLAAQRVWGESLNCKCMVELDPFCQKVLMKNWPGVTIHDDIKTFKGSGWGTIDILTGGFPCQPFSVAGKQGGREDDRYLWPEMLRVIKEAKPRWVVGENVTGIINLALDDVLTSLEGEGYETETFIIPACGADAKHRRNRVWIVANNEGSFDGQPIPKEVWGQIQQLRISVESANVANPKCKRAGVEIQDTSRQEWKCTNPSQSKMVRQGNGAVNAERIGACSEDVADNDRLRMEGERPEQQTKGINERNWMYGWEPEPSVGRVADGIPSRVDRLKSLGNSIVPQVAERIFWGLRCVEEALCTQG